MVPDQSSDLSSTMSLHAFAFTGDGGLILSESEGTFDVETWKQARSVAEKVCCEADDEDSMDTGEAVSQGQTNMHDWLVSVATAKAERNQTWKRQQS